MLTPVHFAFCDAEQLLPREKIQQHGVASLTTVELLQTILGSGSARQPVTRLATKITDQLHLKKKLELSDLLTIPGIGTAKACQIVAAVELVERLRPMGTPVLDSLQKVLQQLGEIRYLSRETIVCLYLNARMQLLLKETVAIGSVNQSIVSPRDIFSVIKEYPISYLILAHNHPSGVALPSSEDVLFTQSIQEAGHLLGVEVLDHVIMAKEEHYSFREQHRVGFKG